MIYTYIRTYEENLKCLTYEGAIDNLISQRASRVGILTTGKLDYRRFYTQLVILTRCGYSPIITTKTTAHIVVPSSEFDTRSLRAFCVYIYILTHTTHVNIIYRDIILHCYIVCSRVAT
jgi:hypothetical protein